MSTFNQLQFLPLSPLFQRVVPSKAHADTLTLAIEQQVAANKALLDQMTAKYIVLCSKLDDLVTQLNPLRKQKQIALKPAGENSPKRALLRTLCGAEPRFVYRLKLSKQLPEVVYKERAFSIRATLTDADGRPAQLTEHCKVKLLLFTAEAAPRLLKITTGGDKIMRGTTSAVIAPGEGDASLERVVVKEVTSHFQNGFFYAVLMPSVPYIKPVVIPRLVIKARKTLTEPSLRKRAKIENTSNLE